MQLSTRPNARAFFSLADCVLVLECYVIRRHIRLACFRAILLQFVLPWFRASHSDLAFPLSKAFPKVVESRFRSMLLIGTSSAIPSHANRAAQTS